MFGVSFLLRFWLLLIDTVCVFIQLLLGLITIMVSPLAPGQYFQLWQRWEVIETLGDVQDHFLSLSLITHKQYIGDIEEKKTYCISNTGDFFSFSAQSWCSFVFISFSLETTDYAFRSGGNKQHAYMDKSQLLPWEWVSLIRIYKGCKLAHIIKELAFLLKCSLELQSLGSKYTFDFRVSKVFFLAVNTVDWWEFAFCMVSPATSVTNVFIEWILVYVVQSRSLYSDLMRSNFFIMLLTWRLGSEL